MDNIIKERAFQQVTVELGQSLSPAQVVLLAPMCMQKHIIDYVDSLKRSQLLPTDIDSASIRILLQTWTREYLLARHGINFDDPSTLPTVEAVFISYVGGLVDSNYGKPIVAEETSDQASIDMGEAKTPNRKMRMLSMLMNSSKKDKQRVI